MKQQESNNNLDPSLLVRFLSQETTEAENRIIYEWMQASPDNREAFLQQKKAWDLTSFEEINNQINIKDDHLSVISRIALQQRQEKVSIWKSLSVRISAAAMLILLIGLPLAVYFLTHENVSNTLNQIEVPFGSRTSITLIDGTKIWLNAGSNLRYDNNFNKGNRKVYLEGEAYFDVTKNKSLPFIVNTSDINLKVLGTAFNVKCYKDEGTIETTLVRGSVMIESKNQAGQNETTMLKPNEKAIFIRDKGRILLSNLKKISSKTADPNLSKKDELKQLQSISENMVIKPVFVEEDISWKDGYFLVNNESLEALMIKLSRRYDITYKFMDQGINDYCYTGKIKESSLEQMLNALKLTSPLDFVVKDKEVLIKENKLRKKEFLNNYR